MPATEIKRMERLTLCRKARLSSQWAIVCFVGAVSSLGLLLTIDPPAATTTELVSQFLAGGPSYRSGYLLRTTPSTKIRHLDLQDVRPTSSVHHDDRPRIVLLEPRHVPFTRKAVLPTRHAQPHAPSIDPNHYIKPYERPFVNDCTPMADWQRTHHPNCNILHEIETNDVSLLSLSGSWRSVWKVSRNEKPLVLKMLHLHRTFDQESFGYHQVDARIMEQLTWSQFIVESFGFCGQSVLTEWAPQDGRSLIKDKSLSSRDRLVLARDLAIGLNHVHSLDFVEGKNATFVHNDINIANIVNTHDHVIKYNDFNIGAMLRWNKTQPCGYPVRFESKLWRSPEEIANTTYVSEKTDLYALGNVLFQVLTKHQPWTWLEPNGRLTLDEVARKKLEGGVPHVPSKYLKSNDLTSQGLFFGTLSCYRLDPTDRPTAHELATAFQQVLLWHDEATGDQKKISVKDVADLFAAK